MSDKPYLKNRLIEEFRKFTNYIFRDNPLLKNYNTDGRFEEAVSNAVDDYTDLRVLPIEQKNEEQDRRLSGHDNRLENHEQRIARLENSIGSLFAALQNRG